MGNIFIVPIHIYSGNL